MSDAWLYVYCVRFVSTASVTPKLRPCASVFAPSSAAMLKSDATRRGQHQEPSSAGMLNRIVSTDMTIPVFPSSSSPSSTCSDSDKPFPLVFSVALLSPDDNVPVGVCRRRRGGGLHTPPSQSAPDARASAPAASTSSGRSSGSLKPDIPTTTRRKE